MPGVGHFKERNDRDPEVQVEKSLESDVVAIGKSYFATFWVCSISRKIGTSQGLRRDALERGLGPGFFSIHCEMDHTRGIESLVLNCVIVLTPRLKPC